MAEALDESLSPAEKRSIEAERRAAWRKARLKSLENVSFFNLNFTLFIFLIKLIFTCIVQGFQSTF